VSEDSVHLAVRAADGDRGALDELVVRHVDGLRAFVRLRVGAELRARESNSDLVQSVCREVLQDARRFQHPSEGAFKSWLYTTALRKIADRVEHWRTLKRDTGREERFASEATDGALLGIYHSISTPSQHAVAAEERERIERAFEQLSEEQREVIVLARVAGLSRAEIAVQTNRSEGAVRVLLHRALARLSDLLAD
jgi:RNA polymerase sigma-70 factor (ECF subfamily)